MTPRASLPSNVWERKRLGEKMSASKRAGQRPGGSEGFSAEERAAMKERAREARVEARGGMGADKSNSRSATLAFSDQARLDDGPIWPTSFALTALDGAVEAEIAALLKRAAG